MTAGAGEPPHTARTAGVTAAEHAYRILRSGIVGGRYAFGTRLGEVETSEALGVSRTPLREALRRLRAEGLVEIAPHSGAQVANWTVHDVEEIYELRICLEPYGASRAAERMTAALLDELTGMCDREADAIAGEDFDAIRGLNADFHQAIMNASGNVRLVTVIRPLIAVQAILRTFRHYEPGQMDEHLASHRVLVEALDARDSDWASSTMRSHLIGAKQRLVHDKQRAERAALAQSTV